MLRRILIATAIAGTLDLLAASILTAWYGRAILDMLRYVASGPFPMAIDLGAMGAILGVAVHFTLMAIMAATYLLLMRNHAARWSPWASGVAYGLITYVIMNLIVVPLRFGTPLPPNTVAIVSQVFCHVFLVGIPIALVARRTR